MDILTIELTKNTPSVVLDPINNCIKFEGDSRPEDVQKFYAPVLEWISNYGEFLASSKTTKPIKITCDFQFEYFNSSSAKYVMDIILKLGIIGSNDNVELVLNWHFDIQDEDMKEAGEEFEEMLDVKFNYFPVED